MQLVTHNKSLQENKVSGFDKVITSYAEALDGLEDNMTIIAGGFGLCGIPENLIKEIKRRGTKGLTIAPIMPAPMAMA